MKQIDPGSAILDVIDLVVEYPGVGFRKPPKRVIDGVNFSIAPGETLALVGESGSGKSTIGNTILGLTKSTAGTIIFEGEDITHLNLKGRRRFATDLQAIFQNPYGSLNPALKIRDILTEPLQVQRKLTSQEANKIVTDLLKRVGLPDNAGDRYPSHFSGGQRQRIAIARAVSVQPKLIICDEATSSLDVSTQAAVLELLGELKRDFNLALLFITHHLALIRNFADNVIVLNKGKIVEIGPARQVCDDPQDLYTQLLVAAVPVPDPIAQAERRQKRYERMQLLPSGSLGSISIAELSQARGIQTAMPGKPTAFPLSRWNPDNPAGLACPLPRRIAFQLPVAGAPLLDIATQQMAKAAQEEKLEFIISNAEGNPIRGITQMQSLVQQGLCGMASALDPEFVRNTVEVSAMQKGTAVVQLNGFKVTSILSSIQYEGGRTQADYVVKYIKEHLMGDGQVLYIGPDPGGNLRQRVQAFKDGMSAAGLDPLITSNLVSKDSATAELGFDLMNSALEKNPNINVVVCYADVIALGALDALKAAGKWRSEPKLMVCGIDGIGWAIDTISAGNTPFKMTATVHVPMIGYLPGKLFGRWAGGKTIPQYQVFNYNPIDSPEAAVVHKKDYDDTPRIYDDMLNGDNKYVIPLGEICYEMRGAYYDGGMPDRYLPEIARLSKARTTGLSMNQT